MDPTTMLRTASCLFVLAALGGLLMAGIRFFGKRNPPPWVALVQMKLLDDDPAVVSLFRSDPFAGAPPTAVRTVLWQYWFTSEATHRATGAWWRRELLGEFTGTMTRSPEGRITLQPPQ